MIPKLNTIALVLNIIASALYIALSAMCIIDKSWGYAAIAFILIVCHAVLVKEIRKKAKNA